MAIRAHHREWTFAGRVAAVGVALLAVGCGRTESEPRAAATRHPIGSSASAKGEPDTTWETACRKHEHSTVSTLQWPLIQAAWRVESQVAGRTNLGAGALGDRVDKLWQRLTASCPKPSTEAEAFAAQVRRSVDGPMDARGLDALLASYRDWATVVGLQHMGESLLKERAACQQLIQNVHASYAVWWDRTPGGKDYWVQMIVQNDTDKRLLGDLDGSLWVTDPLPGQGPAPTTHLGRRASRWVWGGSSADFIGARPHSRSTQFVGVGEYYKLHLGPQGTVFDVRPSMFFKGCSLPVHRDH